MNSSRFRSRMLAVAAAALAVDVATKTAAATWLADGPVRLGPLVSLRLVHNRGVAFGVAAAAPTPVVVGLTAAVAAVIATLAWRGELGAPVAAGLVVGGAVGNVADRLTAGSVVDFLDVGRWPTFNLADVFLVAGLAMLFLAAGTRRSGSAVPTRTSQEA
jgi:signal peptidase II